MRIKGKRVLKNGAVAGYILQILENGMENYWTCFKKK